MARPRGGDAAVIARVRRARGLTSRDYYALAGFFDAEGYFCVSSAGRTPRCSASIGLRDDDAAVVRQFCEATGLGHVVPVPARRRSKPQVRWLIGTKIECRALAAIFDRYPLLGRKKVEGQVWSDAVERWCTSAGPARSRSLREADAHLRRLREYNERFDDAPLPEPSWSHLLFHFGGFFSGDGSLMVDASHRGARMVVRLRRDDTLLLQMYRQRFGIGQVIPVAAGPGQKPVVSWHVTSRSDLAKAVEVLDAAPLLGLKKAQYEIWRPAALELADAGREKRPPSAHILTTARDRLTDLRRYKAPSMQCTTSRFVSGKDHRDVYREVLRTWAATQVGPLSCTAYMAARRNSPEWPSRNTLAINFDSWHGALRAAGLDERAPRRGLGQPTE